MTRGHRLLLVPALALVAAAGAAGCGGSGQGAGGTGGTGKSTDQPGPPPATTVSAAPATPGMDGARTELADEHCAPADGRWGYTARLHNPGTQAGRYAVTVTLSDPADGSVLARRVVETTVAPGADQAVEAPDLHPADRTDLRCLASVTRTAATGG